MCVEEFVLNFEEPNKPVLLEGCMDNWAALRKWDMDYLVKVCGDVKFAVGPVEMKLEEYFRYADQVREERRSATSVKNKSMFYHPKTLTTL